MKNNQKKIKKTIDNIRYYIIMSDINQRSKKWNEKSKKQYKKLNTCLIL